MAISKLSTAEFVRDVEQSGSKVVVDFYAEWCGPCHQIAPTLEELARKWEGNIRFAKVDIDENPDLALRYAVFSIPTIILFESGNPAAQTLGANPAHVIEQELRLAADAA